MPFPSRKKLHSYRLIHRSSQGDEAKGDLSEQLAAAKSENEELAAQVTHENPLKRVVVLIETHNYLLITNSSNENKTGLSK